MVFIPVEFNGERKWANVRIKFIERKWFDNFGEFYTYVLEHAEVTEVLDEQEIVNDLREYLTRLPEIDDEELIREVMVQYGVSHKNAILLLRAAGFRLGVEHSTKTAKLTEVVMEKLKS